ncbi:AraC family transcriptional regulator [Marinilongibacter aquaticus]|uniref:AraC family transcriptional regulator n=1 Tax=Marinilongibacter aquaticus TaxID=2975157 RepID=UPI0021BD5FD1|nr:AraC family transcriptional regulator [Marinilongibacter aquaticus]UBM59527.1 AraC family transcriptional regulator [Marinilongibacter aquaticus]
MEIRNLYRPFELDLVEVNTYEARSHKNTFFEMVFVLEGTGAQLINKHKLPYASDKLFLIFPEDSHTFEVDTPSKFFFIRFNDSYLKTQERVWVKKLEYIFHNHNHSPGCILKTVCDKPLVRALVEALIREHINRQPQQEEVIEQLMNTIITIAARNITLLPPSALEHNKSTQALPLLNYIHHYIYEPKMLKVEAMAEHFNFSPTYIGEYFKAQTGESLQEYITAYKLKLIETRLRFTDMQINEIVHELGFSDASHLNRLFKKYKGMSPSAFKKAHGNA